MEYKRPFIPDETTTVKFIRQTVVSEKELEKLYVDTGDKEVPIKEWVKQIVADNINDLLKELYILFHYGIEDKSVISQEADRQIVEILQKAMRGE